MFFYSFERNTMDTVSTNGTQKKSSALSLNHFLSSVDYLKTPPFLPPLKHGRRLHGSSRKLQGAIKAATLENFTPS